MDYANAVADLMTQRRAGGLEDVPLGMLITARAFDMVQPGLLSARDGFFYVGSRRMNGNSDLYGIVPITGVEYRQLQFVGDQTGLVMTDNPPAALLRAFDINDIADLIGANNVEFLGQLAKLWTERIGATDLQPAPVVTLATMLLSAGVIVAPATAEHLTEFQPRLAMMYREVPNVTAERRAAWYTIVEAIRPALAAYARKNLSDAAAAVAAAARNVAILDAVYTGVEAVANAPATVAGWTLDGIKAVLFRPSVLIVAGLAVVGAVLWFTWPSLARKVISTRGAA